VLRRPVIASAMTLPVFPGVLIRVYPCEFAVEFHALFALFGGQKIRVIKTGAQVEF
jgi:hypothetical protein